MPDRPQVETRDVAPRTMWLLGLGFAVFIAGSAFGLLLFFSPDPPWAFDRAAKPEPTLQISPAADLAAYEAEKRQALSRRAEAGPGLRVIPIEQAMRLVAQGHRATVPPAASECQGAACPGATPSARTIP